MTARRIAPIALLCVVLAACGARGGDTLEDTRYTDRTLLLPDTRFRIPGGADDVAEPVLHRAVDPDQPLPEELVDQLWADPADAILRTVLPRTQREIEEWIGVEAE